MTDPSTEKRIVLFALGGTIAAPVDAAGGGATMTLTAANILGDLAVRAGVMVEAHTFRQLPSASLRFGDLLELAELIRADTEGADSAAGVVITVGTDTLEEIAYGLDLLLDAEAPVVVTGAMRNAGLPGADGPANLLAGLRVAASADARGQGVLVVLNDEIHLARYARKTHSSSVATFRSENVGTIGWLTEGRVQIALTRQRRPAALRAKDAVAGVKGAGVPAVGVVRLTLDDDPAVITAVAGTGCAGLVVEVFGAGHVAESSVKPLAEVARSIPVVFASRTGAGGLHASTGSFPGSERDLLDAGLIPAGALDGPKSRVLLSLLLWAGATRAEIAARFANE